LAPYRRTRLKQGIIAAYFLIDNRFAAELYKIHLQAETSLDIIWPVTWKLSGGRVFLRPLPMLPLGLMKGIKADRATRGGFFYGKELMESLNDIAI